MTDDTHHPLDSSGFERLFREVARVSKPEIHAPIGSAQARPPEVIGSYRILGPLGRGGMGVVYRAEHLQSSQVAAIKTVRVPDERLLAGIRREIHVLARLRHPGVVRIIEEGLHDGLPWYAMELLEGATLRQWRAQGAEPPVRTETWWNESLLAASEDEACHEVPRGGAGHVPLGSILNLVRRICEPLAFLHGEGIVHRDLKPENILLLATDKQDPVDGTQPVLMDFGLVAQFGGEVSREELEVGDGSAGTVAYMAPEQIRGELVDARADLYSLGCIVYELIAGRPPFVGPTARSILQKHQEMEPVPPSRFAHEVGLVVPPELDALVLRLLSKRAQDRVGYADDVAARLVVLGAKNERNAQAPRARSYLYRPGFAGREDIVPELVSRLDRLASGVGGLVLAVGAKTSWPSSPVQPGLGELILMGGESGVGKTRLAMELARRAELRGIRVLAGEGLPLGAPPRPGKPHDGASLQALRPLLRAIADRCRQRGPIESHRLLGRRQSVLAQYEPSLSQLPGLEPDSEPEQLPASAARAQLFSDLAETVAAFVEEQPLLLILDDLQWADELTLGFLEFLLRSGHLERTQMIVLGAYRSEELGGALLSLCDSSASTRFDLKRLDADAVRAMTGDILALFPPPLGLSRFLSSQSEGNPFFVAEYLRLAVEEKLLYRDDDGRWQVQGASDANAAFESLPLPRSLRALVSRRLDGLPREAMELAAAAAVVGRDAPARLLGPMTGLSDEERMLAVAELLRRQVLEELVPDVFRFVHDKIREVLYTRLETPDRQRLHRAAAEVFETVYSEQRAEFLGAMGHHWEAAGEPERSRGYYLEGAQRALGRSSFEEAVALARNGTRLGGGAKARLMLIEALHGVSNYAEALREAREAVQLPDASAEDRLRAEVKIAHVLMETGDNSSLMLQAEEVLRLSTDSRERADGLYFRATALRRSGRCDEALAQHAEALAIAGQLDRVAMVHLDGMGITHIELGAQERAIDCGMQSLSIARKVGHRRGAALILHNLGVAHYDLGDYQASRTHCEESLEINRAIGHRFGVAHNLNQLGILHDHRGDYEQALAVYHEALAINRAIGQQLGVALNLSNIGCAHYFRGELEAALAALEQSLSFARDLGMPREISNQLEYLGLCYAALGRFTEAEQALGEGIEITQAHNLKYSLANNLLARSRARLGCDTRDGSGDAEQALGLWREMGNRFREGSALATLARYDSLDGRHVEAARKIESARALVPEGKDFNLYLQLLEDEAVVRAAASDRAGALSSAREVAQLAKSCGALTALRRIEPILSTLESR